jgi:hypothetical protein
VSNGRSPEERAGASRRGPRSRSPGRHRRLPLPRNPRRKPRPPREARERGLTPDQLRRGIALGVVQLTKGVPETTFAPFIYVIAGRLGLHQDQLGFPLLGISTGLAVGSTLAGLIVTLCGSRLCLQVGQVLWFGAIPFTAIAPSSVGLFSILAVAGFGAGLIDLGWLEQSLAFEPATEGRRKPWIPRHLRLARQRSAGETDGAPASRQSAAVARHLNQGLQVPYAPGALAGAGIAALALGLGWQPLPVLGVACGLCFAASFAQSWRLDRRPEQAVHTTRGPDRRQRGSWRDRVGLLMLLVACAVVFLPLGVTNAWSALFLRSIGTKGALSTLGLIDYYAATAVGGALAWYFSRRFQRVGVVVAGGLLAVAGGLTVVLPANAWAATLGFGMIGLGLSPAGPFLGTRGGQLARRGNPRLRLALVNAFTYVGGFIGQPLVARLTAVTSLRLALLVIPAAALTFTVSASLASLERATAPGAPEPPQSTPTT